MNAWIPLLILAGVIVGFATAWLVRLRQLNEATSAAKAAQEQLQLAVAERDQAVVEGNLTNARHDGQIAVLNNSLTHTNAELDAVKAQLSVAQEQLDQHQAAAKARDLAEAERAKSEVEQEGRVLTALSPVAQKIADMERKLVELEQQRQSQYGQLGQQLAQAQRSDESLQKITSSIAAALKNNSVRGRWGEAQLRNIVESAGLLERVDFDTQASFDSETGKKRPDMVVHIPGGKSLAVDAKVPFSAYIEANEISPTATGEAAGRRKALLADHAKALREHVKQLSGKEYWDVVTASPDFVVAFVPSESLLSAAVDADPGLLDFAFSAHVALASPVTLWSVLRTVSFMWRQEDLSTEAEAMIATAKELHGRLATLSEHVEKLRKSLQASVTSFNSFTSALESRVLVTARKLDKIDDAKSIVFATTIETEPKHLSAPELACQIASD